jgi:hypothetical protein
VLALFLDDEFYANAIGIADEHGRAIPPLKRSPDDVDPRLLERPDQIIDGGHLYRQAEMVDALRLVPEPHDDIGIAE